MSNGIEDSSKGALRVELTDEERTFYHNAAWLYLKTIILDFDRFPFEIEDDIRGQEFPHVLDGGTGSAAMIYRLLEILKIRAVEILGIDIDRNLVDKGNFYLKRKGYNHVNLEVASIYNLQRENGAQIPDEYFNLVTGLALLEHVDAEKALKEIFRITAPGGIVYFPHNIGDTSLPLKKDYYQERYKQGLEPHLNENLLREDQSVPAFTMLFPWHPLDEYILSNFEKFTIGHQMYKGMRCGNAWAGGILEPMMNTIGFTDIVNKRSDWILDKISDNNRFELLNYLIKVFAYANNHPEVERQGLSLPEKEVEKWLNERKEQLEKGILGYRCIQRSLKGRKPRKIQEAALPHFRIDIP